MIRIKQIILLVITAFMVLSVTACTESSVKTTSTTTIPTTSVYITVMQTTQATTLFVEDFTTQVATTSASIYDTPYEELTNSQKLKIISWIEDRYDYYDNIEGKYCGDKYTNTIFNEAGTKFNKTYSEIDSIWSQSYELKY